MLTESIANLKDYILYLNLLLAFILGLSLGSFFTALASRILYYYYGPGRKSNDWVLKPFLSRRWSEILTKPSHCQACGYQIKGIELWPIIGYLYSQGRCRNCQTSIGPWTLIGEIIPALMLVYLIAIQTSWPLAMVWTCFMGLLFISIATDTNFYQLDHENAFALAILCSMGLVLEHGLRWEYLAEHIYSGAFVLVLFSLLYLLSGRRGLGFADIILATIIATSLGIIGSLIAIQVSALFSIVYIYGILRDRRAPAPLGTGLALGWMVALPIVRYLHYQEAIIF